MSEDMLIMKNNLKILISIFIIALVQILNQPLFAETLRVKLTLNEVREVIKKDRILSGVDISMLDL